MPALSKVFFRLPALCLCLALEPAGCKKAPPTGTPRDTHTAHLAVTNLTGYQWRIAVSATKGPGTHSAQARPRGSLEFNLPGGDYVIEQTLLKPDETPESSRQFEVRLEPGQTYEWSLATLLTGPTAKTDIDETTKPEAAQP